MYAAFYLFSVRTAIGGFIAVAVRRKAKTYALPVNKNEKCCKAPPDYG